MSTTRPKMPHNNTLSTSNSLKTHDIWSKTIGVDSHAPASQLSSSATADAERERGEKGRKVMELARSQNLTGASSSSSTVDDGGRGSGFGNQMFWGLKGRRKGRGEVEVQVVDTGEMSSEDEYEDVIVESNVKAKEGSSSDEEEESTSDDERKKKKAKKEKKAHKSSKSKKEAKRKKHKKEKKEKKDKKR